MLRAAARTYVFVGGALILVAGAIGFVPFSVDDAPCGSAFIATSEPFQADLQDTWADASDIAAAAEAGSHQTTCGLRRNELRLAALTLVGIGAAALASPRLGRLVRSVQAVAVDR